MGKLRDKWDKWTGVASLKESVSKLQAANEELRSISTSWYGSSDVQVIGNSSVSASMAMKLAAVYRCTSIVSGTVASLPLVVKKKINGCWQTDEDDRMSIILGIKPNERQTRFDLIRNAVIQILNQGNAYIYPEWRDDGELGKLVLLSPNTCTYDKENNTYMVNDFTNKIFGTFDADEMIHLRNMSTDGGYTGVSTLQYAAKVLRISAKGDDKSEEVYSPGGTRRGFITGANDLVKGVGAYQDAELSNVADRVAMEMESGKTVMNLPNGTDFKPMDLSPADTQLLENKKFGVLEICRFYGVHPDKVFAGQSTNYKASEMSQVLFMSDTLQQILQQFALEFTSKLFLPSQYGRFRVEFSIEDFYNTDLMTLASFTEKNIATGVWTINEARRKRGYAPVPGGDEVLMSANLIPVGYKKISESATKNLDNTDL
nr:MAG TPA: portal protein [Caudoviricetes sp.]